MQESARMAPFGMEALMVEAELVRQMRRLASMGWGVKRISGEVGVSRNTVRRYLRGGVDCEKQIRPRARCLADEARAEAVRLFEGAAEGNAVVVCRLLTERGVEASVRTIQRAVAGKRRDLRVPQVATVRFETAPGRQMQIDFGQKLVRIAAVLVRVHLLVAVLSYSRRLFVKAFLSERQDDWREGIGLAFEHFGGVPQTVLGDNAKALVVSRDGATQTVRFHPGYLAFCRDWGVVLRACGPYRARTKGKGESGVKFVKCNALAGQEFESFAALESYFSGWMQEADQRVHGTTHEAPLVRFERDEKAMLRALPLRRPALRERRLQRRVANDALVDVDTVRYSVPHRLVRDHVEVHVGDRDVRIYHGSDLVATHARSVEPYARVIEPGHYDGLWRTPAPAILLPDGDALRALGRSLDEYAIAIGGES